MTRHSLTVPAVVILVLSFSVLLHAQDVASITGVVTDQSGAVIPDVNVTLSNPQTGVTYKATTNAIGSYTISQVKPGPGYTIEFKCEGFRPILVTDLYLNVDASRVQNAELKPGAVGQTVEVSAATEDVTLNTTDSTVGNNFQVQSLNDLPIQDRSKPSALFVQQPGTTLDGAVAGARVDQSRVTVDGLDVNDRSNGNFGTIVGSAPVDSVQEFRGVTAGAMANANGGGGGQFELVTRSGTNSFHGSLVEYHRDTALEANDWFNNNSGVPRPPLIRNQFGGNVGGPVLKNKLFFFFDYNARRDTISSLVNRTVPLDSFRNGILSYLNSSNAVGTLTSAQVAAFDPLGVGFNSALLSLFASRYPHSNNSDVGDGLNTGGFRFNAPAPYKEADFVQRIDFNLNDRMKFFGRGTFTRINGTQPNKPVWFPGDPPTFPLVDRSFAWVGSFVWSISNNKVNQFYFGQVKQNLSQLTAYNPTGATQFAAEFGGNGVGFPIVSGPYAQAGGTARNVSVPLVRDNFSWEKGSHSFSFGGVFKWPNPVGLNVSNFVVPSIGLGGSLTGLDSSFRPADLNSNGVALYDAAYAFALAPYTAVAAGFNYNSQGNPFPEGSGLTRSYKYYETELYFGDSWKVMPKLTVSYGLRWVNYTTPYEVHGIQSAQNIDYASYIQARIAQSAAGQSGNLAVPLISYDLAGKANHAAPYFPNSYKNFGPRLAMAYSPKPTLVFNAGAGLIFDQTVVAALTSQQSQSDYLFTSGVTVPFGTPGDPRGSLATEARFTGLDSPPATPTAPTITRPFYPFVTGSGSSAVPNGLVNGLAFNVSIDNKFKTPYSMVFNFGVQDEFAKGYILKMAYVGRMGRRLMAQVDVNQIIDFPDPVSGQLMSAAMGNVTTQLRQGVNPQNVTPQPWYENVLTPGIGISLGFPNNTALVAAGPGTNTYATRGDFSDLTQVLAAEGALPPNVGMGSQFSSDTYYTNLGSSSYNGLLMTLHKNFASGLQFDLNYTWSHSIDNVSLRANIWAAAAGGGFVCDVVRPRECRGNSDFDVKHYLNGSFLYDLPFGRGKRFGSSSSHWMDALIGGWSLSGLPYWHSGNAYNVISNAYVASYSNDAPAIAVGPLSDAKIHVSKSGGQLYGFSNPTKAQADFIGPVGLNIGSRNNLRGPKYFSLDMGLGKNFAITEKVNLKFRTDAFNVLNHPNFSTPCVDITNVYCPFGVISSTSFPSISTDQQSRVLQLSLRLEF